MKLFAFILVLYCIPTLVLADKTCPRKCPDELSCPVPNPNTLCKPHQPTPCKCPDPLPNGDCADSLPNCGKPIRVAPCGEKRDPKKVACCNKIDFSKNLDNHLGCPNGTKAWPLLTPPWVITYEPQDIFKRDIYKINGQSPGPTVHANKGDWILIPVFNKIKKKEGNDGYCAEMATIHWHGITMRSVERQTPRNKTEQPGTPFMDGVPGVNQCPIPSCGRFDYFFQFVDSGTFWYHSHYEIQIADGLSGAMIVRDCKDTERFEKLYGVTLSEDNEDNYIVNFKDWFSKTTAGEEFVNNYVYALPGKGISYEPVPDTGLVGKFIGTCDFSKDDPACKNLASFNFIKSKTYRLRLINTSAGTLFNFSIDNHDFEVVEVDGMLVERNTANMPNKFMSITINTGQRYSILVTANQEDNKAYWMRFFSSGCYKDGLKSLELRAIVRYNAISTLPKQSDSFTDPIQCTDVDLHALIPYCGENHPKYNDPTYTLFCKPPRGKSKIYTLSIMIKVSPEYVAQINDKDPWTQNLIGFLSTKAPQANTVYWTHKWDNNITDNSLLNVIKGKPVNGDFLNAYDLNEQKVYDIFFKNDDVLEHPIHLHGHFFYVLGFGIKEDEYDPSKLNLKNPIQRDVVTVPARGWAQIRFVADNPGVWPMHCHIDWHLGIGMMAQFVELPDEVNTPSNKKWFELCKSK